MNERDELGRDLVPHYMTSVRDGGFYGWPYSYYGSHVDEHASPLRLQGDLRAILRRSPTSMGAPVGVVLDKRGALLVADDVGNVVWRASAAR